MAELGTTWSECYWNRKAVCPYCGLEQPDSWAFEEGETVANCQICGELFTVECEIEIRYTTTPKGGWPDE